MGGDTDPFFGNVRAGFEGTGRLDRREWGITWNTPPDSGGLLVSDRIQLEFELSLIKLGCAGHTHSEERAARGSGAARSRIP